MTMWCLVLYIMKFSITIPLLFIPQVCFLQFCSTQYNPHLQRQTSSVCRQMRLRPQDLLWRPSPRRNGVNTASLCRCSSCGVCCTGGGDEKSLLVSRQREDAWSRTGTGWGILDNKGPIVEFVQLFPRNEWDTSTESVCWWVCLSICECVTVQSQVIEGSLGVGVVFMLKVIECHQFSIHCYLLWFFLWLVIMWCTLAQPSFSKRHVTHEMFCHS